MNDFAVTATAPSGLTDRALAGVPGIAHGFFTREGGVSEGIHAGLNCGFGSRDRADHVAENRRRARRCLDPAADHLLTVHQVHGRDVVTVDTPWPDGASPRADALVTTRPGIALGVLAADCAPVLLAAADGSVVGAAHAGWRGALGGVLAAVVAAMRDAGADGIVAAIGPCIGPASYQVGPEFRAQFLAEDAGNDRFFAVTAGADPRPLFDLAGYVAARLGDLGVAAASVGGDTCAEAGRFFSYRRACRRGEDDYGRNLSAIVRLAEPPA